MKRIEKIRALALVLALLVGAGAWAQRKPRIQGNRNPVEITESLPPFKYLRLEDDLEVRIRQQGSGGYELRVDDNLVDVLQFQVQDSTLVISSFYDITGSRARVCCTMREAARNASADGPLTGMGAAAWRPAN